MKRSSKTMLVFLVCLVFFQTAVLSAQISQDLPLNNSNDLLASTVPILYGEASFRTRILQRTEGKREPVALVLSGGSARAFAHIGVLRYLEEQGIVPDLIISNSMGSMVGILYAAGLSPEQIYTVCSQLDTTQLFDLTWPLMGAFLDTSRFSSLVAAYLGDTIQLEELPIPIMIVSEDIATKRQVRIMEGSVLSAFDASFALPVYFPPVAYRGHLLIDGGFTNLVPLDIAYTYTDTVIVSTTFYEGKDINLRNTLSILNTSIDIGKRRSGVALLQEHPEAIWIRCNVEDFSFMDFAAIDEIAQEGYSSAQQHEEELRLVPADGTTYDIRQFRADFSAREDRVLSNYRLYRRVPQHRFSQQLFLGLRSYAYERDPWYLRDDTIFGLMYSMRFRRMNLSVHGGMGWEPYAPMDVYPGLGLSLSFNPIAPILLEADFVAVGDDKLLPSWYQRAAITYKQNFSEDRLHAEMKIQLEHDLSPSVSLDAMLVHAGVSLEWAHPERPRLMLFAEGGWQLAGNWGRHFLHTRAYGTFPLGRDLNMHLGYTGRYALDGKGDVPFYREDGYKTADTSLLTQGRLSSTVNSNSPLLIVGRTEFNWQPESFRPTAGELLIFQDSSLGVYGEFLWTEPTALFSAVSAGIQVSTTISLLGLNSLPTALFAGYDGASDSLVWGFHFGGSF